MSNLPNPASDGELDSIIEASKGNWEFTIAMKFTDPVWFDQFRKSLDKAIQESEFHGNVALHKSIAPVGTTETHIDTRLQEDSNGD